MKKCTLFIGNGLNLVTDGDSWAKVVEDLAESVGKSISKGDTRPFPLIYEELLLVHARNAGMESDFKKQVAESMQHMLPNELHDQITTAKFSHILTTNYDYCLEKAIDEAPQGSSGSDEIRYSLFRRHQLDNTSVWHVHGEVNRPASINLGHEHYAGALGKMRSYMLWDRKRRPKSKLHSAFRQGVTDFDADETIQCAWTDVFLRDDVYILGLDLDYSEIDLWWMLVAKERLKWAAFDSVGKKLEVGNTYYYYPSSEHSSEARHKEKIVMLTSLGVNVEPIRIRRNDWKTFYAQALQMIITRKNA